MQRTLKNRSIFCRDNLEVLRGIDSETVDLIYLDPPFNKKKEFTAPIGTAEGVKQVGFRDIFEEADLKEEWLGLIADTHPSLYAYLQGITEVGHKSNKYYLCYMAVRLLELHRVLKPTGSLYYHCDPTMGHFIKLLLDTVFGEKNFRNEIVWHYRTYLSSTNRHYPKKHDLIYWYGKTNLRERLIIEYLDNYEETVDYARWKKYYVNGNQIKYGSHPKTDSRFSAYLDRWVSDKGRLPKKGEVIYVCRGYVVDDVWMDVQAIDPKKKAEKVGYPTQKPLMLLKRIIKTSTKAGELVLDPFCGCATTCVAAEILKRQWIGIDVAEMAFKLVKMRLRKEIEKPNEIFKNGVIYRTDIPARTDLKTDAHSLRRLRVKREVKKYLYGIQEGYCGRCRRHFESQNLSFDHIVPRAKGGDDTLANLQLLCGHCNSIKGQRDMAYLRKRLKADGIIE